MRKIQIVPLSKMEEMRKIFNNYLLELSEFDPDIKFDEKGVPIYIWYDCYWEDKDRYPLYLIIDNSIAGIAMIRELDNMLYDFAEFYVLPEYRKDGNAIWFACEIANLFQGQFVFSTRFTNPRAIKFWGKFASLFELNEFVDDEIWRNWTIRKISVGTHSMGINEKYFNLIKSGEKTLEGRLNDSKRKKINVGDKIEIFKDPERIEKMDGIVLDKYLFSSFEEMATKIDKAKLGFGNKTNEEIVATYNSFYSKEDEKKYGVAVFKIKIL